MAGGKRKSRGGTKAAIRLKVTEEQARVLGRAAAAAGESAPEYVIGSVMLYSSMVMRAIEAFMMGGPLTAAEVAVLLDLQELRSSAAEIHGKMAKLAVGLAEDKHLAHREHLRDQVKESMASA